MRDRRITSGAMRHVIQAGPIEVREARSIHETARLREIFSGYQPRPWDGRAKRDPSMQRRAIAPSFPDANGG
jgi:hypothetical protein